MRHERACHMLKRVVAKCEGCGQNFTTSKLIWNAIGNLITILEIGDQSYMFNNQISLPI